MKNLCVMMLVLTILTMSVCTKKVDTEADIAAIREAGRQIITTMNEDNVDAMMAVASADHITMPPNMTAFTDIAKLRAWQEERIPQFSLHQDFSSKEIIIAGGWAIERWTVNMVLTPRGGGDQITDKLKGIWIWHRRKPNGAWKLARSIWNSDNPIPTTE